MKAKHFFIGLVVLVLAWMSGTLAWLVGSTVIEIPQKIVMPKSVDIPNFALAAIGLCIILWIGYKAIMFGFGLANTVLGGGTTNGKQ